MGAKCVRAQPVKDFFDNLSRYPRYFITITLGIFFALFGWLQPLLSRPSTAIAVVGLGISGICFIGFTLRAMLGYPVL